MKEWIASEVAMGFKKLEHRRNLGSGVSNSLMPLSAYSSRSSGAHTSVGGTSEALRPEKSAGDQANLSSCHS